MPFMLNREICLSIANSLSSVTFETLTLPRSSIAIPSNLNVYVSSAVILLIKCTRLVLSTTNVTLLYYTHYSVYKMPMSWITSMSTSLFAPTTHMLKPSINLSTPLRLSIAGSTESAL
jgi:hypothetical protein